MAAARSETRRRLREFPARRSTGAGRLAQRIKPAAGSRPVPRFRPEGGRSPRFNDAWSKRACCPILKTAGSAQTARPLGNLGAILKPAPGPQNEAEAQLGVPRTPSGV